MMYSTSSLLLALHRVHYTAFLKFLDGCPIRPFLSAIGTFNCNSAKFSVPILDPLTNNKYIVKKKSVKFIKEILNIN